MRRLLLLAGVLFSVAWLAGCLGQQPTAQAPPIINNITPVTDSGGDSGLLVMLTVVGGGAFLLFAALVAAGVLLYNARRDCRDLRAVVRDIAAVTDTDIDELIVMSGRCRRALAGLVAPQARTLLPGSEVSHRTPPPGPKPEQSSNRRR